MKVLFASSNYNKFKEIEAILKPHHIELIITNEKDALEIIEDRLTFHENAGLKALTYAVKFNQVTIADDSGIIVDQIKPLPGIYSKRYSGMGDHENNIKLLDVLKNSKNRTARFVCAIAIAFPDGKIFTYEGNLEGTIATTLKGGMGFGYDPLFIPNGQVATLGELSSEFKNLHSHRRQALNNFLEAKNEVIDYWRYTWQK